MAVVRCSAARTRPLQNSPAMASSALDFIPLLSQPLRAGQRGKPTGTEHHRSAAAFIGVGAQTRGCGALKGKWHSGGEPGAGPPLEYLEAPAKVQALGGTQPSSALSLQVVKRPGLLRGGGCPPTHTGESTRGRETLRRTQPCYTSKHSSGTLW